MAGAADSADAAADSVADPAVDVVAVAGTPTTGSPTVSVDVGFTVTPEQVDALLAHCQAELDELRDDLQQVQQAVAAVHEPAPDPASVSHVDTVRDTLNDLAAVVQSDIDLLTDWQDRLTDARGRYLQTEGLTVDQWRQLAQGTDA